MKQYLIDFIQKSLIFLFCVTSVSFNIFSVDIKSSDTSVILKTNKMIFVPGGSFEEKDSNPLTGEMYNSFEHRLSPFYIGKYEVSYQLWYTVYRWALAHNYHFENQGCEGNDGREGAVPSINSQEPVTMIYWYDCVIWCNAFSEMTGQTPVYHTNSGDIIKDSREIRLDQFKNLQTNWNANGYRLPTEGEWKYAASDLGKTDIALVPQKMLTSTYKVDTLMSNKIGLVGTRENVWEWCWDWYHSFPEKADNYRGPISGDGKIYLGGQAYFCDHPQAGYRLGIYPTTKNGFIGFRIARNSK